MRRILLAGTAILISVAGYIKVSEAQAPKSPPTTSISSPQMVLNKYCVTCHNEKLHTAEIMLDKADIDQPTNNAAIWEKVLHKLRTREMPPARMPRPDEDTYDSLANYLETSLDHAAAAN